MTSWWYLRKRMKAVDCSQRDLAAQNFATAPYHSSNPARPQAFQETDPSNYNQIVVAAVMAYSQTQAVVVSGAQIDAVRLGNRLVFVC